MTAASPDRDARRVHRALERAGLSATIDRAQRASYSSDASLYRASPQAIAFPRSSEEIITALDVARRLGVSLVPRGAGTSVAGNAISTGILLDCSRHLDRIVDLDPVTRTARVQPGVVQADLQRAAAPYGLRFGPDPSTSSRCTIGGMVGNDACGSRSLAYGRTADNVEALSMVTGTGEMLHTDRRDGHDRTTGFTHGVAALDRLADANLALLRSEFGRFGRQVSGYPLHHLLPENGRDLTRALVGTEGTLGTVTEAVVRLVSDPAHSLLLVLGYDDMVAAAADVPALLAHDLGACEGLDRRIVDVVAARRSVPDLPSGDAWLFVEVSGGSVAEARARAEAVLSTAATTHGRLVPDPAEAARLWAIRADGAGLAGRAPSGLPAWPGWEDAAVPPERLADYLTDFEALLVDHGLTAMPFGHFGDGCVHVRLDFPLSASDGPARLRRFLEDSAATVARHGGSLSGEHGDGRARSELLPHMYSPQAIETFAQVKRIFDPDGVLNPGVLVSPAPIEADLRIPTPSTGTRKLAWAYPADSGDFSQAVHRCTGVGKCRVTTPSTDTVMCPSYAATRSDKDSTRGRARVLQEMLDGGLPGGWRDPAVHDALDLCLACKGCASDCPTGVDMATYKAEVLHQTYRRRLRPRSHYTLGWLPRWADVAQRAPRLANALTTGRWTRRVALWTAGVDARRSVPRFAERTWRSSRAADPASGETGTPVVLFVDSFTDHFAPQVADAAHAVLLKAGYAPSVSDEDACCGLTWISTGQLDAARRRLARTVDLLEPAARAGHRIVGLEPSCTAALRHDAVELLDTDAARLVASMVCTLAELLTATPGWSPPDLTGVEVVAQPHCHQHAVLGWEADARLLSDAGARVTTLGGCCGLAGNFGVERGHHDVSVQVAGLQLLPALEAAPDALVLADGFSCRTQVADLAERPSIHLAELLHHGRPGLASGRVTAERTETHH